MGLKKGLGTVLMTEREKELAMEPEMATAKELVRGRQKEQQSELTMEMEKALVMALEMGPQMVEAMVRAMAAETEP